MKKTRKPLLFYIFLGLLLVAAVYDSVSTSLVFGKHPTIASELEINPIFSFGVPLWGLIFLSLISALFVFYTYLKYYFKSHPIGRYLLLYLLIFIILMKLVAGYGNMLIYRLPTEQINPIPKEERTDKYIELVSEMDMQQTVPGIKDKAPPQALVYFFWNFIIFLAWYNIENGYNRNLSRNS